MLLLFLLSVSISAAETAWLKTAEKDITSWQSTLDNWIKQPPTLSEIEESQKKVFALKQKLDECEANLEVDTQQQQAKLDALGEADDNDTAEIKKRRAEQLSQKQASDEQLALCRVLNLNIKDLQNQFKPMRNEIVSNTLSHRGEPVWEAMLRYTLAPSVFKDDFILNFEYWPSTLVGLVAFLILFPLARYLAEMIKKKLHLPEDPNKTSGHYVFMSMLAQRLPWVATFASLILIGIIGNVHWISALMISLALSMLLAPLLELLLCHDRENCRDGLPARALLDLVFIGIAMKFAKLDEILTADMNLVLQSAYYLLLMTFSLWLMLNLSKRENFKMLNSMRTPVAVAMLSGPVAMWIGYHSLAHYLIPGVYGSLAGLLIAWGVLTASGLFFGMFEPDQPQTNKKLRTYLGYNNEDLVPGLWIGRLLMFLSTIAGLLYWMSISWSVPDSEVTMILSYFNEGFTVGAINIVPSKIVTGVLALFILLTLAKWFKNQLSDRWLSRTRLDIGAKESIVSLSSYAIVGLSILIALSMAGVDFQNIAIVAGALSVGIGFGLQNIVNNFVSGLILLFERPVKPGDWVIVGSTEGYVRKISIRYTLIQTFDRAEVMVPNSELISTQLTNWMLKDRMGRVIVPVGVAYGTNTQQVLEILENIGKEHSMVMLNDWRVPGPKVLFMGFGESSLDFELRCFIRDVDYRMSVKSDLLFAIDKAFAEANIEIPFPQRVLHMAKDTQENTTPPEQNLIDGDMKKDD